MDILQRHFILSVALNLALLATAWLFRDFYIQQLYFLLFFPAAWILIPLIKSPAIRFAAGNWFPAGGVLILAAQLLYSQTNTGERLSLFEDNLLLSFAGCGLILPAGLSTVFFSFSRKESRWNRLFLAAGYFILWRWVYQAHFAHQYEAAGWLLLLLGLAPVFWEIARPFPLNILKKGGRIPFPVLADSISNYPDIMAEINDAGTCRQVAESDRFPVKVRRVAATKIIDNNDLYPIFKSEKDPAFKEYLFSLLKDPAILEKILLDENEPAKYRLKLLRGEISPTLFKRVLPTLSPEDAGIQAIKEVNNINLLKSLRADKHLRESYRNEAARNLLDKDWDNLSRDFMEWQLKAQLPLSLSKNEGQTIRRILRNALGYYGMTGDLELLANHFPSEKAAGWYEKYEAKPGHAGHDEGPMLETHWAIGNCFYLLPDPIALPSLRSGFFKAREILQKQKEHNLHESQTLFQAEMALAALLQALGACAAKSESYQDLEDDADILEDIESVQNSLRAIADDLNTHYQTRSSLLTFMQNIQRHSDYTISNSQEFLTIQRLIEPLENRLKLLVGERDKLEQRLSPAHYLIQVASNGQDYHPYVRQHACGGLFELAYHSFLDQESRAEINGILSRISPLHVMEKGHRSADIDPESAVSDPGIFEYELRLMPKSKKGEVNLVFYKALSWFMGKENQMELSYLFTTIEELCRKLPEALLFLEQYPLRIMPRANRSQLAYYREAGYNLEFWTKYRPPKNTPNHVIYRFLAVQDFTRPNNMGIVYHLFWSPLLLIPVLYHEYQHYRGIRNEAEVWLKEQYFLRNLIAESAPDSDESLQQYMEGVVRLFIEQNDPLTLCLLNTNFRDRAQQNALNGLILRYYGPPLSPKEAALKAEQTLHLENMRIFSANLSLTWDPFKRYPQLGAQETRHESGLIHEIVRIRKAQKNTLTPAEFNAVLNSKEINSCSQSWESLKSRLPGWDQLFSGVKDLGTILEEGAMQQEKGDLLVFKS